MRNLYSGRLALTFIVHLITLPLLLAGTITVTSTNAEGSGSLEEAAANARSGDTIRFATTTNGSMIMVDDLIVIMNKDLTIIGNGMDETIVSGGRATRIFSLRGNSQVKMTKLSLRDGRSAIGGAVRVRDISRLTLHHVRISDSEATGNDATQGGGAISSEGTLILDRVMIVNNSALGSSGSGGGILNKPGGVLIVRHSLITGNTANRAGGGIEDASGDSGENPSEFTIVASHVTDNIVNNSPGNGGGIHVGGDGMLSIESSRITGNLAGGEGGGIWLGTGRLITRTTLIDGNKAIGGDVGQGGGGLYNSGGTMLVNPGTIISNNTATQGSASGGGILNSVGGSLRLNDATVVNNEASRAGGGIEDASGSVSSVFMINSRIDSNVVNNNPGNGGGIHVSGDGSITVIRGSVSNNVAGAEGGGLWNGIGTMNVRGVSIIGNTAMGSDADQGGGGIFNSGGILRVNPATRIANNTASGQLGSGGGVFNALDTIDEIPVYGVLRINDATIANNTANRAGGGVEHASGENGVLMAINSRIDSNIVMSSPGNGGGVHIGGDGDGKFVRGSVSNNTAGAEGGGLWNNTGTLMVWGVTIDGNTAAGDDADQGGGGIYNNGAGTLRVNPNTRITNNSATGISGSGGGIFNGLEATLTINDATVSSNSAVRAGGGVEDASGSFSSFLVINAVINENTAIGNPGNGGGIHLGGNSTLKLTRSSVSGNTASSEGGGVWNGSGISFFDDATINDNTAEGDGASQGGGGIYNQAGLIDIVSGSTIAGNQATGTSGSGGGILSGNGEIVVTDSEINANAASRAGGGVEIAAGNFFSTNSNYDSNTTGSAPGNGGAFHVSSALSAIEFIGGSVTNNVAENQGGGLWNQAGSIMVVRGVTIMDNSVLSAGGDSGERVAGGGIYNNGGDLNVSNSTISGNVLQTSAVSGAAVATAGGGIANDDGGTLTIRVSTIVGNSAEAGGGIANVSNAVIINSTITDNTAAIAGGYGQDLALLSSVGRSASLDITGTILSDNDAAEDPEISVGGGTVSSGGYNLFGPVPSSGTVADALQMSDKVNMSAMLGMLADNGGATMTVKPECGSPAINMGNPNDNTPDQLNQNVVETRDIGAYELQTVCPADLMQNDQQAAAYTSGSSSKNEQDVRIYPNPVYGNVLNVNISDSLEGDNTLRVMDASGRVRQTTKRVTAGTFRLSLNDFRSGTYILQVVNGDEVHNLQFIVAR